MLLVAAVVAVPARADGDSSATGATGASDIPPLPADVPTPDTASDAAIDTSVAAAETSSTLATVDAQAIAELTQLRAAADGRSERAKSIRARIVALAKAQVGDRYRAGAVGPNAFDCSGLVRYVYRNVVGRELPHYSKAQFRVMTRIHLVDAKPGDLVFFFRGRSHHVGIYIGDGKMVDAAGTGKGVRISPIRGSWWGRNYTGIGRILPA